MALESEQVHSSNSSPVNNGAAAAAASATHTVLYVSFVFPPMPAGGAVRSGQFVKYLPQFGWRPVVLTAWLPRSARIDLPAVSEFIANTVVVRCLSLDPFVGVRALRYNPGGGGSWVRNRVRELAGLMFPDRQVGWIPAAVIRGVVAGKRARCDVIFTSFGPASAVLVGYWLSKILRRPLVLELRDLWTDHPFVKRGSARHRAAHLRLEARVIRHAKQIVVISESMREHYSSKYPSVAEKCVVIPNGYDSNAPASHPDGCRGGPFTLRYIGSLYHDQSLESFAAALQELKRRGLISESTFRLEVIGNASSEMFGKFGIADMCFARPFVPHQEAIQLAAGANALLLIEGEQYVARYGYAVKVFDYLHVRRPILGLTPAWSNSARLIEKLNAGIVVAPNDVKKIESAILQIIDHPELRPWDSEQERVFRTFDRRALTGDLAAVLSQTASAGRTA